MTSYFLHVKSMDVDGSSDQILGIYAAETFEAAASNVLGDAFT